MSPSVNRSSDSPESPGAQLPEASSVQNQQSTAPTGDASNTTESTAPVDSVEEQNLQESQRQHPIPPPSEPMQYRAIGLIQGQYMPSAEQWTRGTLLAADGTLIDAVLLGRVMSLVKNHLSLEQSHLWVVYPRTKQEDDNLHVQIVGVWEPETLNTPSSGEDSEAEGTEPETSPDQSEAESSAELEGGYFSIRGQVIYQSREEEQVVVKIKQSPRRESEKTKFFKLKLQGLLGDKVIGHFWDLHVQLQANTLRVEEAHDIGLIPTKGKKFKGKKRYSKGGKRNASTQRPVRKGEQSAAATPSKRSQPLPKPVKRREQRQGGASGNSS